MSTRRGNDLAIHPLRQPSDAALELRRRIRQNSATSLGGFFRLLARASVAASMVAAAGCGASHSRGDAGVDAGPPPMADGAPIPVDAEPPPPPPRDAGPEPGFEEPLCVDGQWRPTRDMHTAIDYDYLALYHADPWAPGASVLDEQGTACATAIDPATCATEVAVSSGLNQNHLVTTDADGAQRYIEPGEVAGLLGPIDTAQEALIVVWHAGYSIYCGDPSNVAVREVDDGYEVYATRMTSDCDPVIVMRYLLHVSPDGTITELSSEEISHEVGVCVGRRPDGLRSDGAAPIESPTAHFFAHVARLEAAAVSAFQILACELSTHGAPSQMVDDCREAADDEVRHALQMDALAARFGVEPIAAEVEDRPLRALYDIAFENAVEGCVRETFGALVGTHQSLSATDPTVADTMRRIADDEIRHAALSWRIAEWIEPQLSPEEQRSIARARAQAITDLRAEMQVPVADALRREAGLPAPEHAVALVDQLTATIWA